MTKLPTIKNPQKNVQSVIKRAPKNANVPHYMRLRKQDVENKMETKKKINDIIKNKPKIVPSPNHKWIPVKIEPKGAALNAKFFKNKKKPSIEVNKSDHESSMARLRKLKHNPHDAEFDRSESHCRRCEACRNKRDAFNKMKNKNNVKEASSTNEEEIADEEKDSFHSHHDTEDKATFQELSGKLNKVFGRCIDDKDASFKKYSFILT